MSSGTLPRTALMLPVVGAFIAVVAAGSTLYNRWATVALALAVTVTLTVLVGKWLLRGVANSSARRAVGRAFYTGLAVRLVVAPVFYFGLLVVAWKGRPGIFFDDETHYANFANVAGVASWSDVWQSSLERIPHVLYLLYTNSLFLLFDDANLVVRLFSAVLAALIIPVAARIALHVATGNTGIRISVLTAWITALSPELILFSVAVLREWMIALVLALAVLMALELLARWHTPSLIVTLTLSLAALVFLRVPTALLLVAVLGLWAILETVRRSGSISSVLRAVALPGIALFALLMLVAQMGLLSYSPLSLDAWYNALTQRYIFSPSVQGRIGSALAESGSFLESSAHLLGSKELGWLLAATKRLLSPSPLWFPAVGTFNTMVYWLPGLFWYALLPVVAVGAASLLRAINTSRAFVLLIVAGFVFATISPIGLGLEPLRARVQILPLLYVVGAQGLFMLQVRPALRRRLIFLVVVLYLSVTAFYYMGLLLPWPALHPYSLAAMGGLGAFSLGVAWLSRGGVGRAWSFRRMS